MGIAIFYIIFILIAGCSNSDSSSESKLDSTSDSGKIEYEIETVEGQIVKSDSTDEKDEEPEDSGEESQDVNQLIADDENIKITFLKIERESYSSDLDDSIEIYFEIENKMDRTIYVNAEAVSSDGKMVDSSIYSMYQDISPNKLADVPLTIVGMDGKELPTLEENLELTIAFYDEDDYNFETLEYPVEISIE